MNGSRFAPVIEYKGVCILEASGNLRAVWNGQEYRTDGKVYLFSEDSLIALAVVAATNSLRYRAVVNQRPPIIWHWSRTPRTPLERHLQRVAGATRRLSKRRPASASGKRISSFASL